MERSYDFLFWAYNVVWIVLAGYVVCLAYRLRKVTRKLDALEKRAGARASETETP